MAVLLNYALTSVADVSESLEAAQPGIAPNTNLVIRKINQATEMIEKYCDRRFLLTTYTNEEYDSNQTDQLVLKQRPIVSFTEFNVRDTSLNQSSWEAIDPALYFVDMNAAVIDCLFRSLGSWNRVRVTYSAGYATIPSDLAEAAAYLATFLYLNPTVGGVIRSKQEGQRKVEYYNIFNPKNGRNSLFDQLDLTPCLDSYCNYPVLADK